MRSSSASSSSSRSSSALCPPLERRISSSSFTWRASESRFWVLWMRNTIRNVMMVVPVLMMSCQVSLKPKSGPVIAQSAITATAAVNAIGRPVTFAVALAKRVNQVLDRVGRIGQEGSNLGADPEAALLYRLARLRRRSWRPRGELGGEAGERLHQRVAHQPIEHPLAVAPARGEAGVLEHREVARHRRPGDAQASRQIGGTAFGLRQLAQHLAASARGEGVEDAIGVHQTKC